MIDAECSRVVVEIGEHFISHIAAECIAWLWGGRHFSKGKNKIDYGKVTNSRLIEHCIINQETLDEYYSGIYYIPVTSRHFCCVTLIKK